MAAPTGTDTDPLADPPLAKPQFSDNVGVVGLVGPAHVTVPPVP